MSAPSDDAGRRSRTPRQGPGPATARPEALLLVCRYDPNGIALVPETISCLQRFSRFPITVLNLSEHRYGEGPLRLMPEVDLDAYAGILLHGTVTGEADDLDALDAATARKLKDFAGVKVLMRPDGARDARRIADHAAATGYDLVLTCLHEEARSRLYPAERMGATRFERMLGGYVTPGMRAFGPEAGARTIDIGYRGPAPNLSLGRLAYERHRVGEMVARRLAGRDLALDISNRAEVRLGGDTWYHFLRACKATLGAEAGASVFDLDGELAERCRRAEAELGPVRDDDGYAQAYLARLADLEGRIDDRHVSSRHFEAAACGTLQLLLPGRYDGIFVAGRHYFALDPAGDNLDEAVALLRDEPRRRGIVEAAYEDVVLDRRHWIETFIDRLDDLVEEIGRAKGVVRDRGTAVIAPPARNVLLLSGMEPRHDPRHGWTERHAPADVRLHQLGVLESDQAPILRHSTRGGLYWAVPRLEWPGGQAFTWMPEIGATPAAAAILHELAFVESASGLPQDAFARLFSAPPNSPRLGSLRFYLRVLLATTVTLVEAGRRLRGVQAIIASDIYTLPAAILLKSLFGCEVLYDAHEYMPDVLPEAQEFEKQFFSELERRLVAHTFYRQTVTPGLAALMSAEYGQPFEVVVNAEPVEDVLDAPAKRPDTETCVFLFCGLFGAGRGLDVLVDAWPETVPSAILHLQGPHNGLKQHLIERAEATGLLGTRIFFPDPVAETEIVAAMARADVGLVPYEPISINHRFCCPNKLSQYMAAGVPILANRTEFVGATVTEAGCGRVVSFRSPGALAQAVAELAADPTLRRTLSANAREYHRTSFNWQVRSRPFYSGLNAALVGRAPCDLTAVSLPEAIVPTEHPQPDAPVVPEPSEAEPPTAGASAPSAADAGAGGAAETRQAERAPAKTAWRVPRMLRRLVASRSSTGDAPRT